MASASRRAPASSPRARLSARRRRRTTRWPWSVGPRRPRTAGGRASASPTEAEWEKAARGVDGRRYPWGSRFDPDRVNAGYTAGTAAAGSYGGGASPYGVLDMAGNVWEWTSSLYRPYPYEPGDGREDPAARGARVNRGGSWYYGAWYARTTYRATADHMYRRIADLGFRCASSSLRPDGDPSSPRREH